jgi:pimeloyl-ACP methyl ester carboxylesterase
VAACCRSTTLEILPGAGHHPWVDAPERFLALVADFLTG